jgi:ring-1,2-phenylacetyl-CoA epoxidase subunit PaaD
MTPAGLAEQIDAALAQVADPEIPAVSVLDMGMIKETKIDGRAVTVVILPTFTGCPAIDVIKEDVRRAVEAIPGIGDVDVEASFDPPWTSDRITSEGREKLKAFGISPPTGEGPVLIANIGLPTFAVCPFCGSKNTRNENVFGPTPCRALYHCSDCKNPFEQFKPV